MKGKKFVWLLGLLLLCLAVSSLAAGCNMDTDREIGPYYAEYGQVFVLPDFAGDPIVKDADGNTVAVTDGRFTVDRKDDYSLEVRIGKTTYRGKIIVQCVGIPQLTVSQELLYGTVNTEVVLPTAIAVVDGETVGVSAKLTQGETEIPVNEGRFTPSSAGEYTYTFTAIGAGKTVSKAIPVYIEQNDVWQKKIASFDKPYGTNQVRQDYGVSVEYSTERKYGSEAGSTKVTIDTSESQHEATFAFGNFHVKDWSAIDGIRMYIYNDNTLPATVMLNWLGKYGTTLLPKTWTQFYMSGAELGELQDISFGGNMNLTSADGINMEVMAPVTGRGTFSLYFSALYNGAEDVVTAQELQAMINEFTALQQPNWTLKSEIENAYEKLSDSDKSTVGDAYATFTSKVNMFIAEQAAASEIDDANVIAHTDRAFGQYQLQFVDSLSGYSTNVKYGAESGSTLMQPYGFFGRIVLPYATVTDLGDVETIEYYIYNANAKSYTLVSNERSGEKEFVLPAKEWTHITMDVASLDKASDIGWFMQIYSGDWNQGIEKECPKFYLSQMRVVRNDIDTAQKLKEYINEQGTLDDAKVARIKRYYGMLSASEQTNADTFYRPTLKEYYLKRDLGLDVNDPVTDNRVTYFDSGYGTMQIESRFGDNIATAVQYSYSTTEHYEGQAGSLLMTGGAWHIDVSLTDLATELSNYDFLEFYIKYVNTENNSTYTCIVPQEYGCESAIDLRYGEWTKVTLNVSKMADRAFRLCRKDFSNNGVDSSSLYRFYISAVYGVPKLNITTGEALQSYMNEIAAPTPEQGYQVITAYDALEPGEKTSITSDSLKRFYLARDRVNTTAANRLTYFDSEYGVNQMNSSHSVTYDRNMSRHDEGKGAVCVQGGGGDGWNIKMSFQALEQSNLAERYSALKFYVYNQNPWNVTMQLFLNAESNPIYAEGTTDKLQIGYNTWTEITVPITSSITQLNFIFQQWGNSGGIDGDSYKVYFSAVYGVPKTA